MKQSKVKKAVLAYHANNEKERKKDEQKNERMRMQKLMQEDEEGYRCVSYYLFEFHFFQSFLIAFELTDRVINDAALS